ncbi:MAG: hypothetical protein KME18_06970 [Phormidium tanganyikae FI6-MK23]|nr:hypothetical protein [Phormidium tanganyikae FI6-MK23]
MPFLAKFQISQTVRLDIIIGAALAVLIGVGIYQGQLLLDPSLFREQGQDIWFDADVPNVFQLMTERHNLRAHSRTERHPLLSLVVFSATFITKTGLRTSSLTAVQMVNSAIAALWVGTLYTLLRTISCVRLDSIIFSLLGATSAAAVFGLVIPESFPLGSLTILAALMLVAWGQYQPVSSIGYVIVSVMTLSITVTNWMFGLLASIVFHSWKQALQITTNAFLLVQVLWFVQKKIFPSARFFLDQSGTKEDTVFPSIFSALSTLRSFFAHSLVMPSIQRIDKPGLPYPVMSVQTSVAGSGSAFGGIALVLWLLVLGLGIYTLFTLQTHSKLRLILGITLIAQVLLHLAFGSETFLYSLHFVPLLIVCAALTTLTRLRLLSLTLTGILVLALMINNGTQFNRAIVFLKSPDLFITR